MYKSKYAEKIQSRKRPETKAASPAEKKMVKASEPETFEVKSPTYGYSAAAVTGYSCMTGGPMRFNSAEIKRTPFKLKGGIKL